MKKIIVPVLLLGAIASCDTAKKSIEEQPAVSETTTSEETTPQINERKLETFSPKYLNTAVRPQDDFFEFANGSWLKDNPVPPSESRWGSFNELDQSNKKKLTAILEELKDSKAPQGTMAQILGHYYSSFISMERRNGEGTAILDQELKGVNALNSKSELPTLIANLHKVGISGFFGFGVGQDLKNVNQHIAYFGQGGIGLPNKDYYLKEDKADILKKYEAHIIKIMEALGRSKDEASAIAKNVIEIETKLAKSMMAPAELRIPERTYNKVSTEEFFKMTGSFDVETYISNIGIESFKELVVGQPDFAKNLGTLIEEAKLPALKHYLTWKVADHYAGHLSEEFVQLNFDFFGKVLSGKTEMKPINERAIEEITHQVFAELLGKAFVARHYSDAAQARVNTMVDNLLIVFEDRINNLEWMSSETKTQALEKLHSIGRKLGFPSKWEDFSSLEIHHGLYAQNIRNTNEYAHKKNMAKLHQAVDKDEWGMPAHMVNAYYHPLLNEIAFPAGIMQEPFFSDNYEDAVNYGRIGMVIGHEFTHGFDDMGSKFDPSGAFNDWWQEGDRKLFEARTETLGKTFEAFCPVDDHCVNPALTMGENIADLGGLTLAYHAYTKTEEFKSGKSRNGYTPAQRFFIAYAQLWKINYTEEELKNRIANDPHSPGMYRVNGPLMNCPEFFDAFNVKEGEPMRNAADKVAKIW